MHCLTLLQARCSSTRLPGKVLKPLAGVPMILRQIERIDRAHCIENLVVATSTDQSDDPLVALCQQHNITFYRGPLDDVLTRFYQAAQFFKTQHIVRLTADCPLIDPDIIDQVMNFYWDHQFDYVSNIFPRSFPDGMDVEVFNFNSLEKAFLHADNQQQREHVTPYIYQHPELFTIGNVAQQKNQADIRLTVDTLQDFLRIEAIFNQPDKEGQLPMPGMEEI